MRDKRDGAITADCGNAVHREQFDELANEALKHLATFKLESIVWAR
jgi:hypothetical protein